ncbi:MAG: RNB domain-containing ribonuclease, partial [Pseudomonadota bacterium]
PESMSLNRIAPGSLVLYKSRPARVTEITDKIEIRLDRGQDKRVRDKDVVLLHPGPVNELAGLGATDPDLEDAWSLLQGESVSLAELAELLYGAYTPDTAWSSWELLSDGLYFSGTPEQVEARDEAWVGEEKARREHKEAQRAAWDRLLARLRDGAMAEEDRKPLAEVERLALGRAETSRILEALGIRQTPEQAHRFLARIGYWVTEHNPHPQRQGAPLESARGEVPDPAAGPRTDFTRMAAFAIDDAGSTDPDDAISFDGERLWVHVADAGALVSPDSELDLAARGRGANLYLPEGVVTMLPGRATELLGLGLQEESPALSVGVRVDEAGELSDVEIQLSRVRVRRLSYSEADTMMGEAPFSEMAVLVDRYRKRRLARHAARIDLPETSVRIVDGEIRIRPLERLASRDMVTDAMLMAGEAVARFALEQAFAVPFVGQPEPAEIRQPEGMAAMYAYRKLFKPSRSSTLEQPHFGLGLPVYTRATSPLRRYVDLLTHQQLRAVLQGAAPLDREALGERIAQADAAALLVRRTERLSNQHWKLVWLQRHPEWKGEAVVVGLEERRVAVIIPELAMDVRIRRESDFDLDEVVRLSVQKVDLPELDARFRVLR